MKHAKEQLREKIGQAQKVVVGIGEEFEDKGFEASEVYRIFCDKGGDAEEFAWMLPFLKGYYLSHSTHQELSAAYDKIAQLVGGKDYFVITQLSDDRIYDSSLNPECIVAPCGSYRRMQCEENCGNETYDAGQAIDKIGTEVLGGGMALSGVEQPRCPSCGSPLRMNLYPMESYCETGYLTQWKRYQLWLSCTMNRETVLIEAGAGFGLPNLIRFPFEKVTFFQNKAHLFRIHGKFPQLTEDLAGKGTSVKENSLGFFVNL